MAVDSSYGYSLADLLEVEYPQRYAAFAQHWLGRYQQTMRLEASPSLSNKRQFNSDFDCADLVYKTTDERALGGWLLSPRQQTEPSKLIVVGHGYGGREEPDYHLPRKDAAYLFFCCRGIARSRQPDIPSEPNLHVLHGINEPENYVFNGCVEDTWMAVSAAKELFPKIDRVGYMGISFGGGVGALACPWDQRVAKVHLEVPSFGHHALRMRFPTWGSAHAVQQYVLKHPQTLSKLRLFDAATAAAYFTQPVHVAAALADPAVAPPGQFAIYNAIADKKRLFVLSKGHSEYTDYQMEQTEMINELCGFFSDL